ncbi:MAG: FMNH2-dependent dimethyl sulfone monooxygenase [Gammaproteobacteria bacterium]|jgi:FMNH2-dependent dimethyl sulfone monooxygenase
MKMKTMTPRRPRIFNKNKLKLGFFSPNCSGGMSVTKVPERWINSWDNNLELARLSDEAGIEFLLPIARWVGYGGETDFHGDVLETVTWASGCLARTSDLTVFATVHTAFIHPIVAAKQLATIDQMSHGRLGLNIVCGWNKPEYEAFGIDLPEKHSDRYRLGQEWFDVVKKLWSHPERFDWNGDFFRLKGVHGAPPPYDGTPPLMNAAGSIEGRQFATQNVDFLFMVSLDPASSKDEVSAIKAQAASRGRDVGVFTLCHVVCRSTMQEAQDYYHYYSQEQADWEAVDNLMELQGLHSQSFPPEALQTMRDRFAAGHGSYPLIGDPDSITRELAKIPAAGFAGCTLSFVDYAKEFPYFRDEVIPRLEAMGLRERYSHGQIEPA